MRRMGRERGSFEFERVSALMITLALAAAACGGTSSATGTTGSGGASPVATVTATGASGSGDTMSHALSGTWAGTYRGSYQGTFTLEWRQSGSKLTGTIDLSSVGKLPIDGTVNGDTISFGTVGSTAIRYSGSVSGNSMAGSYTVAGGGSGSWSAHRSP